MTGDKRIKRKVGATSLERKQALQQFAGSGVPEMLESVEEVTKIVEEGGAGGPDNEKANGDKSAAEKARIARNIENTLAFKSVGRDKTDVAVNERSTLKCQVVNRY